MNNPHPENSGAWALHNAGDQLLDCPNPDPTTQLAAAVYHVGAAFLQFCDQTLPDRVEVLSYCSKIVAALEGRNRERLDPLQDRARPRR